MKKAILILLIIIFTLFYYSGFLTKRDTLPISKDFFSFETPVNIDRTWLIKKKSPPDKKELERLYQTKIERGFRNIPLISFYLIRESRQAIKNGESDLAIELSNYSIKFSPDLYQPYLELAQAYWNKSPFLVHKYVYSALRAIKVKISYYPEALKFFYNLFYILSNAILISFIIWGVVIVVKYIPLYFYDIRRNLSNEIPKILINGLKIICLFIPFLLRLDLLWAILFWGILFWGFINYKERRFIVFSLILLVYVPFFLRSSASFLSSTNSEILLGLSQTNYEGWDGSVETKLIEWINKNINDPEVLFSLGLLEKRKGHYYQAEEFYKKAIKYDPQMDEAYSNLGNVYLIQGLIDAAISSYQQAINLNPEKGKYYYNLYKAYSQETFISQKIDKAFQKARQLDPKFVDLYSRIDSPDMHKIGIDELLTSKRLWNRLFDQFIGKEGLLFWLFKAWFERIPSRINFLIPILFLIFIIGMSRYSRAKKFLTQCPMCGSPTYRLYLGSSSEEFICFNCYRIFIQKEKLHPKIMEKKYGQVNEFQRQNRFIGRFNSIFFAGFDYLWRGQYLKGFISIFVFFIFILKFIYWNGVIGLSFSLPYANMFGIIIWVVLFILFYIFMLLKIIKLEPVTNIKRIRK